ncbi:MAG TPA: ATP/GTP-binding protein [Leptolinea sp.]
MARTIPHVQTVKMVVTGPFNAGKTEFIRTVSEIEVVSTEQKISSEYERVKETTTVALDFGRLTIDDTLVLHLFGTPGQRRFEFMWDILAEGMLGYILLVDSTRPETFREARYILDAFSDHSDTPFVVAVNKQDMEDAWDVEDIRHALRLKDDIPVLPCIATDMKPVKKILLSLLDIIKRRLDMD